MKTRVLPPTRQRIVSLATSIGLVLGMLVVGPDAALAETRVFLDPDEKPGCLEGECPDKNFMDFRRLRQSHGDPHRRVRHGIRTVKPWKTDVLGGENGVTLEISFNLDSDLEWEREVQIRRLNGRLRADMYRGSDYRRLPVKVRVWRPSQYSVRVGFPADALKDGVNAYGWRVTWSRRGDGASPGIVYWDSAPEQAWYRHRL